MSFMVYGPGVNDRMTIDQAVSKNLIAPPAMIRPVDRDDAHEEQAGAGLTQRKADKQKGGDQTRLYRETAGEFDNKLERVSLVHQIMSAPAITIREDDSIAKMRAMLAEHNIGLLPVVDKNGDLSGIVTRGDLTRQQVRYQTLARLPVQQIAQRNVLVTSPNTNIRELARVLLEQDIRGLPVLDQEQTPPRVVGVVTRTDVLRAMVHYTPLELWL